MEEASNTFDSFVVDFDGIDQFAQHWSLQHAINTGDLSEEVARQPAALSYYATRYAQAKANEDQLKHDLETLEARLFVAYSTEIVGYSKDHTPKNPTQSQTEAMVKSDARYTEAAQRLLDAKRITLIYKGDVTASIQKGFSLREFAVNIRREQQQVDSLYE